MSKEIEDKLKKIVLDITEKNLIFSVELKESGIDSLDLVEIILKAEEEFNVIIPDDELINLKSLKDVVTMIEEKKK